MILTDVGHHQLDTLLRWSNETVHPDKNVDDYIAHAKQFLADTGMVIVNFYIDNELVGAVGGSLGATLHYPKLVDVATFIHPSQQHNTRLRRLFIEQIKLICDYFDTNVYSRSKHLTGKAMKITYHYVNSEDNPPH